MRGLTHYPCNLLGQRHKRVRGKLLHYNRHCKRDLQARTDGDRHVHDQETGISHAARVERPALAHRALASILRSHHPAALRRHCEQFGRGVGLLDYELQF